MDPTIAESADTAASAVTSTVATAADLAAATALNANAALDKWLDQLAYPSLITLLALAVYLLVTLNVGRARGRLTCLPRKPPAMPILNGFFGCSKTRWNSWCSFCPPCGWPVFTARRSWRPY